MTRKKVMGESLLIVLLGTEKEDAIFRRAHRKGKAGRKGRREGSREGRDGRRRQKITKANGGRQGRGRQRGRN